MPFLFGVEWLWSQTTKQAHAFSIADGDAGESLCKRTRRALQVYRPKCEPVCSEKCLDCLDTLQQQQQG